MTSPNVCAIAPPVTQRFSSRSPASLPCASSVSRATLSSVRRAHDDGRSSSAAAARRIRSFSASSSRIGHPLRVSLAMALACMYIRCVCGSCIHRTIRVQYNESRPYRQGSYIACTMVPRERGGGEGERSEHATIGRPLDSILAAHPCNLQKICILQYHPRHPPVGPIAAPSA